MVHWRILTMNYILKRFQFVENGLGWSPSEIGEIGLLLQQSKVGITVALEMLGEEWREMGSLRSIWGVKIGLTDVGEGVLKDDS